MGDSSRNVSSSLLHPSGGSPLPAVSASEDETETELVESLEVDPLAEADPTATAEARRRRKKGKKGKKKGKKGRKGKGKKKTRSKAKARQAGCPRQDDACIANIVKVLNHVGTIVTNYLAQNARQDRFRTLAGNKKGKATDFDESSTLLETAKNGSSTCGSDASSLSTTLKNCSANVKAKCEAASDIVNTTLLDTC